MNREENATPVTLTGVAVAVVALARFVGSKNSDLAPYLGTALESAEAKGLEAPDLRLLKTVIAAVEMD